MGSAVLDGGRSSYIHGFCFQAAKRSDMDCVDLQEYLFADCQEWHFQVSIRSGNCNTICKSVDLLKFTNSGFRVRNVEICAVLSSNEIDLLMLWNRVFRVRIVQILSMPSLKFFDLLILRNRVLRLVNVHIWVVPPCYIVDMLIFRNRVFRIRNVKFG